MTTNAHLPRGRRTSRPSGDDREVAILTTAERLLAERPLAEISVDDLARGAGISRPTFYFYFPSKDAVLLTLFDRVIAEADAALEDLGANLATDAVGLGRAAIGAFFDIFAAHRSVTLAVGAAKTTNPDMRALWSKFMQKWISTTAAVIEAERARGAAPATVPAADLATALNLLNERAMFAALAAEPAHIGEVVNTLGHIWLNSVYGTLRA